MPGDTDTNSVGILGAITIGDLRGAGFNVLTWDPRGFGQSGGAAEVDSADAEGRDVSALIDWVAQQPGVQLDHVGDPRMGMVGGSYGGGIQFVTAAHDCRVDAIVPVIAWNSLRTSLYKADIAKIGWARILSGAGSAMGRLDPHITDAFDTANRTGTISDENIAWFEQRGPGTAVAQITAPTLIIQGTVDGLFSLDEAVTNYQLLHDAGTPVAMLWYCGGHGVCLTDQGDTHRLTAAALAWLRHYVQKDATPTGPAIDVIDQDGRRYTAQDWPLPAGSPLAATGSGRLDLTEEGGSGPASPPATAQVLDSLALPVTPSRATHSVEVPLEPSASGLVIGAPQLKLTYSGSTPSTDRPTVVFAQIVDDRTGLVVGNQITPIPLVLDGASHTTSVALETIAFTTQPGSRLILQLTPTTVAYAQPQLGGTVTFDQIELTLPTASI